MSAARRSTSNNAFPITLAVSVGVAAVAAAAAVVAYYGSLNQRGAHSRSRPAAAGQGEGSATAADDNKAEPDEWLIIRENDSSIPKELWDAFISAAQQVRAMRHGVLTNGDKLLLYGLYKQGLDGDAPITFPLATSAAWNLIAERAKYAAWGKFRGMSKPIAMSHYITAVQEFLTLEGQSELVTHSTTTNDDETGGVGPKAVSRPAVDNGGYHDENDDDGHDENDPNKSNNSSSNLEGQFLRAAGDNDVTTLESLLLESDGVLVHHADDSGQTALHLAADKGSLEAVQLLLDHGANPCAADHDGISVLQAAVIAGHAYICEVLLKHGADADQADADGDTPRSCALDDGGEKLQALFNTTITNTTTITTGPMT